ASHNRSLAELWRMLGNIDAVHGLYYLVMHGWFAVFPATEFWSRLPSTLAVGTAAAGVVVLGYQTASRRVAVTAGLVFAILPRITWAGIEARSYAMSVAAAVWLTVLVLAAARRQRPGLWALYALGMIAATLLNVFLGLMVVVHAVTVCVMARNRATLTWWICSSLAAMLVVSPFVEFTQTQIAQVNWITAPGLQTAVEVALLQYFDHSVPFAVLAGAALVAPLLLRTEFDAGQRRLVAMAWAWIAFPTSALLAYSVLQEPVYYPRYLCFTTPAVALLLAVSIAAVAPMKEATIAVLAVLAIAATPNYLVRQRGQYAKEGMDFSQVTDVITAHAQPGDCLILDNTIDWKPGPIRPLTAARPSAYQQLSDPGRGMRAADRNRLWDAHVAIWGISDRVRKCTVLWTVSQRDGSRPDHEQGVGLQPGPRLGRAPAYQVPEAFGFHVVERWQFSFAQVAKSTR
ncbi:MAG: glycosyltransferase family 39 protein, partial [Mycobacterium sp.]